MQGNQVFKFAVNTLDQIVDETLLANNLGKSDIDWVVPHQANIRILEAVSKKVGLSRDKVIITVDKHANTSAASIPLALYEAIENDMNSRNSTSKQISTLKGNKTRKKREELSISAAKSIYMEDVMIVMKFD